MTVFLAVVVALVLLGSLLMFPVVGLAILPVAILAALVAIAWVVVVVTRGPRSLPEHPAPDEEPDRY